MQEVWKDISGYEGLYQVSNLGRIKSLERFDGLGRKVHGKIRKLQINPHGYVTVDLKSNGKRQTYSVHRLVAIAFMGYEKDKDINHIDGNKQNNRLENLEWVTRRENMIHAWDTGLNKKKRKPVIQFKDGKKIAVFASAYDAQKSTKVHAPHICACCHGKRKTAGGYTWKYAE